MLTTLCIFCTLCTFCTHCTLCTLCRLCTLCTLCTHCTVCTLFTHCILCAICALCALCTLCTLCTLCNLNLVNVNQKLTGIVVVIRSWPTRARSATTTLECSNWAVSLSLRLIWTNWTSTCNFYVVVLKIYTTHLLQHCLSNFLLVQHLMTTDFVHC